MRYKVISIMSRKEMYIAKKLDLISDFCIVVSSCDLDKLYASKSEIEADNICRRIIREGLE